MQFPGFAWKRDGWQVAMLPLNFNGRRTRNDRLTVASVRHRRDFTSSLVPRLIVCSTTTKVLFHLDVRYRGKEVGNRD